MALGGASLVQLLTWSYLSYFTYSKCKKSTNAKERKWGTKLAIVLLGTGIMFSSMAAIYCLRSVKKLELLRPKVKPGMVELMNDISLRITTFTPFGTTRELTTPIMKVKSRQRDDSTQLGLKVKGYPFYFLLDRQGTFRNTRMLETFVTSKFKQ